MGMTVDEGLAKSLTAETIELLPYLPYLLQDLWELGSSPKDMIEMIQKHIQVSEKTKVLDLACGKGAVSVQIARVVGCSVKGVDLMPEFIDYANKKAQEYGVETLCEFVVADINQVVETEKDFDIVILGAVGDVLGCPDKTIKKLRNTVKMGGFILMDDAYAANDNVLQYLTREKWIRIFQHAGVELIDEKQADNMELRTLNREQQAHIVRRADELKKIHPDQADLFDGYIQSQQNECDELENEILGVTLLLKAM